MALLEAQPMHLLVMEVTEVWLEKEQEGPEAMERPPLEAPALLVRALLLILGQEAAELAELLLGFLD